jgi:hypothetical protein
MLYEFFFEHDVQVITNIDIPNQATKDQVAWYSERNGFFIVKSAYRRALSLKHKKRDCVINISKPDGVRSLWSSI